MWPARIAAATVGLAQICRIIYSGLKKQSTKEDFGLARTISRSGDIKEALYGPLIYAGVLLGVTLGLFRASPIGVIAITQMAAGDGMADIVGRRWGKRKWWFSPSKSIVGTLSFVVFAYAATMALLTWFSYTNCLQFSTPLNDVSEKVLFISVISSLVELLPPLLGDDNISVPLAAGVGSYLLF